MRDINPYTGVSETESAPGGYADDKCSIRECPQWLLNLWAKKKADKNDSGK